MKKAKAHFPKFSDRLAGYIETVDADGISISVVDVAGEEYWSEFSFEELFKAGGRVKLELYREGGWKLTLDNKFWTAEEISKINRHAKRLHAKLQKLFT